MANPRVLTNFTKATDDSLKVTAEVVLNGLTGNSAFPNPTVPLTALATAISEYSDALIAQEQGGPQATAVKKAKREAVEAAGQLRGRQLQWQSGHIAHQRFHSRQHQPRPSPPTRAIHPPPPQRPHRPTTGEAPRTHRERQML